MPASHCARLLTPGTWHESAHAAPQREGGGGVAAISSWSWRPQYDSSVACPSHRGNRFRNRVAISARAQEESAADRCHPRRLELLRTRYAQLQVTGDKHPPDFFAQESPSTWCLFSDGMKW